MYPFTDRYTYTHMTVIPANSSTACNPPSENKALLSSWEHNTANKSSNLSSTLVVVVVVSSNRVIKYIEITILVCMMYDVMMLCIHIYGDVALHNEIYRTVAR